MMSKHSQNTKHNLRLFPCTNTAAAGLRISTKAEGILAARTMKSRIHLLLAAALAMATPSHAGMKFEIDTATCDGDPFYALDVDISCDGDKAPYCTFGDVATIEGTVEALESFDDLDVYLKACLWGSCPADSVQSTGTLCRKWLTPMDNMTCGDAGTYEVYSTAQIPASDVPQSLSWLVKVVIGFEPECEVSGDSQVSGNAYAMAPGLAFSYMGALIGTAFGAAYAVRKCDEDEDEDEEREVDFVEMVCPDAVL